MSKKLLIYGLAFGSAAAAVSYLYIVSIVFKTDLASHLISILTEALVIPGVAIFFFLRSLKTADPDQFMLGKAVFLSFFLSIIIGASVSLLFSYLTQFRPELIARMINLKISDFNSSKFFSKFTAKEVAQKHQEIKDAYSVTSQFIYQLFFGGARGLFLGAIIGYFMKAKVISKD